MRPRRRRGLLLLSLALASGAFAASQVRERERSVDARIGPLVPVVVAARDIPPQEPLTPADLAVERVPTRYLPPDALGAPARLAGARTAVPVAAGSFVTAGLLEASASPGTGPLRHGERALELAVAGGGLALAAPGARVDVLVSSRTHDGSGRTFVALENVELLDLRVGGAPVGADAAAAGDLEPGAATALATLRVTARQAVYLTAAETFAHELRLLLRPPGDRREVGAPAVSEADL